MPRTTRSSSSGGGSRVSPRASDCSPATRTRARRQLAIDFPVAKKQLFKNKLAAAEDDVENVSPASSPRKRSRSPSPPLSSSPALAKSPAKRCSSPFLAPSPLKKATPNSSRRGTPNSKRGTPTQARRALQMLQLSSSPQMAKAKQVLTTSAPVEGVIGREKELAVMRTFLEGSWKKNGKKRRALYVSGAPGTGKTASLKHLLADMKLESKCKVIFLNCMGLKSSKEVFERVASELDNRYDGKTPKKFVEAKICAKGGKNVLLVLDEVDQLGSKDQEVLYSVFEWPQLKGSSLSLIGIANALDLTDRILPRLKLSESVSPQQLAFPAYSRQEILDILSARLKSCTDDEQEPVLKPAAVRFLAAKIAAVSGDMRKALDVCRRAIELAELEHRKQAILTPTKSPGSPHKVKQVDVPQVLAIFNQIYSSRVSTSLGKSVGGGGASRADGDSNAGNDDSLPLQQKLLLACLFLMCSLDQKRKSKEVTLGKLQETYSRVCK